MAYIPIASSPISSGFIVCYDDVSSTLCYTIDGGSNYHDLALDNSSYRAAYTGHEIDQGISSALALNNVPLLNQLTSSGGIYYLGSSPVITQEQLNSLTFLPYASGAQAGIVKDSNQVTYSSGYATLVTSNVSANWENIQNKTYATSVSSGIIRLATDVEVSSGVNTSVAVTPAQLAATTVNSINGYNGSFTVLGSGGVQITTTSSGGSTTLLLADSGLVSAAPSDGKQYVQRDGSWQPFTFEGTLAQYQFSVSSGVSSVTFTLQQFGNPATEPEFDLIDQNGYNITYDSSYQYRWNSATSTYTITKEGGWTAGTYTLKTRGLPGPSYVLGPIAAYVSSSTYSRGDIVTDNNNVYQAINYAAAGVTPADSSVWNLVISGGGVDSDTVIDIVSSGGYVTSNYVSGGFVENPVYVSGAVSEFEPKQLCVYQHTVVDGETITFTTPTESGAVVGFDLDLSIDSSVPSFSWGQQLVWQGGITPDFSTEGTYQLSLKYVDGEWRAWMRPDMSEYLPLSGGTVTGRLNVRGGLMTGASDAGVAFGGGTASWGMFAFRGRAAQTACAAIGNATEADKIRSIAVGNAVKTVTSDSVAIGVYNTGTTDSTVALVVGCGTGASAKKDGMIVRKDGAGTDILGGVRIASGGVAVFDDNDVVISSGGSVIASLKALASGGGGSGGAVNSVNGYTGAVVLDAQDVGAIPTPTSGALTTIQTSGGYAPAQLCVYSHTVTSGEVIAFEHPANEEPVEFKLDLTVPDPPVPFSFVDSSSSGGVTWVGGAPDLSVAGGYQLYFEYDGGWKGWKRPDTTNYLTKNSNVLGPSDDFSLIQGGSNYNGSSFQGYIARTVPINSSIRNQFYLDIGSAVTTGIGNGNALYMLRVYLRPWLQAGLGLQNGSIVTRGNALDADGAAFKADKGHILLSSGDVIVSSGSVVTTSGGYSTVEGDYVVSSGGSTIASLKDVSSRVNALETSISGALASI